MSTLATLKQEMGADWDPASMRGLLFHGTSAVEAIVNLVARHGFLPLLAGTSTGAIWGNGTCFARDAKYSDDYARSLGGSGRKQMLAVDVLVGRFAQGAEGMKVCPILPDAEIARYNSLVNRPQTLPSSWSSTATRPTRPTLSRTASSECVCVCARERERDQMCVCYLITYLPL